MPTVYGITRDLGHAELGQGRRTSAMHRFQESRRIAQELGSPAKEALSACELAAAHESADELGSALELWRQGVSLLREASDQARLVSALNSTGAVLLGLGRASEAAQCYEESAGIARDLGDPDGESAALAGLATAYDELNLTDDVMVIRRRVAELRRGAAQSTREEGS